MHYYSATQKYLAESLHCRLQLRLYILLEIKEPSWNTDTPNSPQRIIYMKFLASSWKLRLRALRWEGWKSLVGRYLEAFAHKSQMKLKPTQQPTLAKLNAGSYYRACFFTICGQTHIQYQIAGFLRTHNTHHPLKSEGRLLFCAWAHKNAIATHLTKPQSYKTKYRRNYKKRHYKQKLR